MNKPPRTAHRPARRPAAMALLPGLVLATAFAGFAGQARANDYPTADRVFYVQACLVQHPGSHYEMVSKCSCALDKLAADLPFAEFENMQTATNANSIGGERGNSIRDVAAAQDQIKRFRSLQAAAKKSCFIN